MTLKKAVMKKTDREWFIAINRKLKREPLTLRQWLAQVIVSHMYADSGFGGILDKFSEPYGKQCQLHEYDELERCFAVMGLPWTRHEPYRNNGFYKTKRRSA